MRSSRPDNTVGLTETTGVGALTGMFATLSITTDAVRVSRASTYLSGRPGREPQAHRLAGTLLDSLRARTVVEVRLGEAGGGGVDLDPSRLQLDRHGERHSVASRLGSRVDGAEDRAVGGGAAFTYAGSEFIVSEPTPLHTLTMRACGNLQPPDQFMWSRSSIIPAFCVGRHPSRCCVSALDAGMSIPAKNPSQPK